MKRMLPLLLCIMWMGSQAQIESDAEKIIAFKKAFLSEDNMYKPETLYTAKALLTRERLPNVRRISTFPKNELIQHDEYYHNDTRILESNTSYKMPGHELTGVTKQYNKRGQLEYIQDHDKGTWDVIRFENYP